MTLRSLVLIGSLAAMLGGCVVAPAPHANRTYYEDRDYYYADDDYYDYYSTPSYEGYYYVRVIFIGNVPYYVDDDRRARPIPPQYHDHFRQYRNKYKDRHAPVFSRDDEVRDGYNMSRVIYFNDVPYYVENGRAARPLPNRVQERFRYAPAPRFMNNQPYGDRGAPQPRFDDRRNEPPAYGRDSDRDRDRDRYNNGYNDPRQYERQRAPVPNFLNNGAPAPSNDRFGPQPAQPVREERMAPAPYERDRADDRYNDAGNDPRQYERQRAPVPNFLNNGPATAPNGRFGPQPAAPVREERMSPQMDPRAGNGPRGNGPVGDDRGRGDARPQANGNNGKDRRPNKDKPNGDDEDQRNNGPRFNRRN